MSLVREILHGVVRTVTAARRITLRAARRSRTCAHHHVGKTPFVMWCGHYCGKFPVRIDRGRCAATMCFLWMDTSHLQRDGPLDRFLRPEELLPILPIGMVPQKRGGGSSCWRTRPISTQPKMSCRCHAYMCFCGCHSAMHPCLTKQGGRSLRLKHRGGHAHTPCTGYICCIGLTVSNFKR